MKPAEMADALMSYFFESDAAQTYLYKGAVVNIQYLLEQYGNNIMTITDEMRTALENLFTRYFDGAQVMISSNDNDPSNPTNAITLTISARITSNGQSFDLFGLVQSVNGKFMRVVNYTNTGVLTPL